MSRAFAASRSLLLLLLVVACGGTPAASHNPRPHADTSFPDRAALRRIAPLGKLPRDVLPRRYRLDLKVNAGQPHFGGEVQIELDVRRSVQVIWLHGLDLKVRRVQLSRPDSEPVELRWVPVHESGVVALPLPAPLAPGAATLKIVYDARFSRQLHGVYRVEEQGEVYAFTQFEPMSARLAFPCFDEPSFKTVFELRLTIPSDHQGAANSALLQVTPRSDGSKRLEFAPTAPLPTYLVAFATGPFDVVGAAPLPTNSIRQHELPLRGLAVKGRGAQLAYALKQTPRLLEELERYFGTPYPYDKLDVVAVPDFAAGAMENAGLITFRDSYLLLDADAAEEQRRMFAYVSAHELAHQWFGNLVTMAWWDDLWLNEAFATWMGRKVVETLYPEYRSELTLIAQAQWTMHLDSLASARRIQQPISSHHDVRNAFDAITYEKGGAVLRMLEHWVGIESFRQGIRTYLQRHPHGNATTTDFLEALSTSAPPTLRATFRSFLDQPGVPQINAELRCSVDRTTLVLQQQRYLPLGSRLDARQSWQLPVCVRYGRANHHQEFCTLLSEPRSEVVLPDLQTRKTSCADWMIPNAGAYGYYRFGLSTSAWTALRTVGWPLLQSSEKLAVVDSLRAGMESGSLPVAEVFGWVKSLAADPVRQINTAPLDWLSFALDYLLSDEQRPQLARWANTIYLPWLHKLHWSTPRGSDETGELSLQRRQVLDFLALETRDAGVRRKAAELGRAFIGYGDDDKLHPQVVAAELVETVLAVAVQESDSSFFDALKRQLWEVEQPWVRLNMLRALASATQPDMAEQSRQLSLNPLLRKAELLVPLQVQMRQPVTRDATWAWIQRNFDALQRRVSNKRAGDLPWLASSFCSAAAAQSVEALFTPRIDKLVGGPRILASVLEAINLCDKRVVAQAEAARQWVKSLSL